MTSSAHPNERCSVGEVYCSCTVLPISANFLSRMQEKKDETSHDSIPSFPGSPLHVHAKNVKEKKKKVRESLVNILSCEGGSW